MSEQANDYAWWSDKIQGGNPPIHECDPQCGYFKIRDRRGVNRELAPAKRPWVAASIWRDKNNKMRAEQGGSEVPLDQAWPWIAKYTISYADYSYWHETETWPEKEKS